MFFFILFNTAFCTPYFSIILHFLELQAIPTSDVMISLELECLEGSHFQMLLALFDDGKNYD